MRRSLFLVVVVCFVISGCAPEGEPVGRLSQPIIGGSPTTGARHTVAVIRTGVSGTGGLCSGTVIGDFAVLTAKHCVYEEESSGSWRAVPRSEFIVVVGHDVNTSSGIEKRMGVYEIRTTPGDNVDSDIENGNDIAVMLLPEVAGTPTRAHATSGPSRGEGLTIIGFGQTSGSDDTSGVKHRGETSVSDVGSNLIRSDVGAGTCQGDSGGPAFDSSNRVTGITSFGFGGCSLSGSSFYTRVAKHTGLIEDALTFEPPCEDEGFETCDGVDNDCDGVVDEGCTALGDPCSTDDECSDGSCEAVDGEDVCVRECDPRFRIPMCPMGFYCESTGCGVGRCIRGREGSKEAGEECTGDLECESRNCADVNGTMRCGRQCAEGEGDPCDTDQACELRDDGCGSCIPVELSTGPRSFGAPCERDDQCASMDCADDGFCTRPCSDTEPCPSGFHCRSGTCVRGELGGLGDPCVNADDCGSMAPECVETEGEKLCVTECDGGECLLDFECRPTEVGDRCVPPGKPLGSDCAENGECRSGLCAGTCTRLCDTQACPEGFACEPAGDHRGCFPDSGGGDAGTGGGGSGGGCSASGGAGSAGGAALSWLVVMVLAANRWRRRRR